MTDYMKRLSEMVPPPAEPFEVGNLENFAKVEAELGLALPADYKQVILTYGSGQWQGFWYILNPFTKNEFLNLIIQSKNRRPMNWNMLDSERELRESYKGIYRYPHAIYPEPGGIMPWGITDNGGRFFWLTKGVQEKWPTIYYPDRSADSTSIICRVRNCFSRRSAVYFPFLPTFLEMILSMLDRTRLCR